jgi:hypothetical protein
VNATEQPPTRVVRWHSRILGFCIVIFALEIGLFLIAFPWTQWWEMNWVPLHAPALAHLWLSRYLRGAITGLGILDVYIAFAELFRLIKSAFAP